LLSYPSSIPLSTRTLNHLADLIRHHRAQIGSRWRRLDPGRQALLALAHLRNGDTFTRLASGFAIDTSTAWRYAREAIILLAARLAYAILDGTLIPIDRVADQKPYYSGKHKRHGVNVQVIADPAGRLVWASPASPGSTHDVTSARTLGLVDTLTKTQVMTFADKGYQGSGATIQTPFKPHRRRRRLSRNQKAVNPRLSESAGIIRHGGGDGRAPRRRVSDPRRPRAMRRRSARAWRSVGRG
jgi:hypothetical protein